MQKWLISVDIEKMDIHEYYVKSECIKWIQWVNYEVEDIVYIYCKLPIGKIMYKTIVEEVSLKFEDSEDEYAILRFVEYVDNDALSFDNLKLHGLKLPPLKAMKLNDDLENYIDNFFSKNFEK